ncbi:MAG TPA: hypothetical protein VMH41_16910 [Mycobacteriales bacterium]|nr:hypothetical protein [Mycobacteriales bacterium]
MSDWGVTVWGTFSCNATVTAETREEAKRLAIEGFENGDVTFDDIEYGGLEAEVEKYSSPEPTR